MNRYPLWKYLVIAVALLVGAIYTTPNFFGESPAVQVSSAKPTVKIDASLVAASRRAQGRATSSIAASASTRQAQLDGTRTLRRHRRATARQGRSAEGAQPRSGRPVLRRRAQLVPHTPAWLKPARTADVPRPRPARRRALPDAGRHGAAVDKRIETLTSDIRTVLRGKNMRHAGISAPGTGDPDQVPRRGHAPAGERRDPRSTRPNSRCARTRRRRPDAGGDAVAGGAEGHPGQRPQAEHHHAAQPRQRARRRRAGDPAARRGPHRDPVAGRAGRGARQADHRPHGDAGDSLGRPGRDGLRQPGRPQCPRAPRRPDRAAGAARREVAVTGEQLGAPARPSTRTSARQSRSRSTTAAATRCGR